MIDAELCKHYSVENGRKNGKNCVRNPNEPRRCMPWLYENSQCEYYEEIDLNELIESLPD